MRRINTPYNEKALLPAVLLEGIQRGDVVETKDGVKVRIEYLGTWNNANGWSEQDLNAVTQSLYKQSFGYVQQVWKSRIMIDDYWHKVAMQKVEDMPKENRFGEVRGYRRG